MTYYQKIFAILLVLFTVVFASSVHAEEFVVRNIQVIGLERLQPSTVLSYLPVHIGDTITPEDDARILSALYHTGFFTDERLARRGDVLVISVKERPSIDTIIIKGNKAFKNDKIMPILNQMGVSQGEIYNPVKLNQIKLGLVDQYHQLGFNAVQIEIHEIPLPRDRVNLEIDITEGEVTKVHSIKIIGNHAFSQHKLLKTFSLEKPGIMTWYNHRDRYSLAKLETDLHSLANFYYNHGYLHFRIVSHQQTLTPDNKHVDLVIVIDEGPIYKVSGFQLEGAIRPEEIRPLIDIKPGEIFSRQHVLAIQDRITKYYTNLGRALAKVNTIPKTDDVNHQVMLIFQIDPGPMVYVREIDIEGNQFTNEQVFRQRLLQMEGAPYSERNVMLSKQILANLPYLKDVQVSTTPVPGQPDEVDLTYHVTEVNAGAIRAQVGYSDTDGFLYGAGFNEPNFFGTGRNVGINFQNSQYQRSYTFSYNNPYYTDNGVSRGFSLFYTTTTPNSDLNQADYKTTRYGGQFQFGIPISDFDRINVGGGYSYIKLGDTNDSSPANIVDFLDDHPSPYNQFETFTSWSRNTWDRGVFPTRGYLQALSLDVGVPVVDSSLSYYKVAETFNYYHPLGWGFVVNPHFNANYGNGYGDTDVLPFFENYYAGGINSMPGYAPNSLGPQDPKSGNALGGNFEFVSGINLVFPNFISDRLRTAVIANAGNVFTSDDNQVNGINYESISFNNLRTSAGLMVSWYSPFGPLEFDVAEALNKKPGDHTQVFDFALGTSI